MLNFKESPYYCQEKQALYLGTWNLLLASNLCDQVMGHVYLSVNAKVDITSFSSQEHCKGWQNPYKVLLSFIHDVITGSLIVHLSYWPHSYSNHFVRKICSLIFQSTGLAGLTAVVANWFGKQKWVTLRGQGLLLHPRISLCTNPLSLFLTEHEFS